MVEIAPVRAWHPDRAIADPNDTICPVYDTLSDAELAAYADRPYNAARFVPRPTTLSVEAFLAQASEQVRRCIDVGAYVQDERPSLYIYGIQYTPPPDILETIPEADRRAEYLLLGLVGALDFDRIEHGQVALHEHTFSDRVDERVALTEATGLTFAPILLGYDEVTHQLNRRIEEILGLDRRNLRFQSAVPALAEGRLDGTIHRIWRIDDPARMSELEALARPLRLLVLDGHHRFTAAAKRSYHGRASAPLVMVVDGHDRALRVLPWHRVVPSEVLPPGELLNAVRRDMEFRTAPIAGPSVERAIAALHTMHGEQRRGFLLAAGEGLWEVQGPDSDDVGADFDLLHTFLEDRLGLDARDLEFHRSPRRALDRLRPPSAGSALLLPGLTEPGIEARAFHRGAVMAHKSTMFLPKVAEGLLFAPAAP